MKIEEFVEEALIAIARGVKNAQANPEIGELVGRHANHLTNAEFVHDQLGNPVTLVKFDLATAVTDKGAAKGEIKILSIGIGGEKEATASEANRITFSVPIAFLQPEAQRSAVKEDLKKKSEASNRGASRGPSDGSWAS